MEKQVSIIIVGCLLFYSFTFIGITFGQEQFVTYRDPQGKFTIQYPSNWDKKENQSGVSFLIPETSAVFAINIQSLRQLEELYNRELDSLEQFADSNVQRIQELGSQRQIPRGLISTTLGGYPVFRGESEPASGSEGSKMLHIWALVDDDAYTFSFSARQSERHPDYQEYLPTIEKMIDSFRFLNVPLDPVSGLAEEEEEVATITSQQPGQTEVTSRPEMLSLLLDDAIQNLQKDNNEQAIFYMSLLRQQLLSQSGNASVPQLVEALVNDAFENMQRGDSGTALLDLNLAGERLKSLTKDNQTSSPDNNTSNVTATEANQTTISPITETSPANATAEYQTNTTTMANAVSPSTNKTYPLTGSNAVGEFETYESKEFGFTIEHPSDWQPEEPSSFEIEMVGHRPYIIRMELPSSLEDDIFTRTNRPMVEIGVEESDSDSLDQYISEQIDELVTFTPNTNVETNKTTLAGLPAYTLVMTSPGGGGKGMHIYTMTDQGRVYDIHYTAHEDKFDTYLPILQRMVDSFKVHTSLPEPGNPLDVEGLETETGDEAPVMIPEQGQASISAGNQSPFNTGGVTSGDPGAPTELTDRDNDPDDMTVDSVDGPLKIQLELEKDNQYPEHYTIQNYTFEFKGLTQVPRNYALQQGDDFSNVLISPDSFLVTGIGALEIENTTGTVTEKDILEISGFILIDKTREDLAAGETTHILDYGMINIGDFEWMDVTGNITMTGNEGIVTLVDRPIRA